MVKILFVDDEEMVLQGLKRMLRPYRDDWDMVFADSGAKALDAMALAPFDVVVADMRMPAMNGAELLNEVMKRYPQTIRFILSGHSDNELILRAISATHQYLAKPCDPATLRSAIHRATESHNILHNPELKTLIGRMKALPSLPDLYREIMEKLQNPHVQLEDVTATISKDIGMTAKILQLVNSAFFGLPHHLADLNAAVSLLGLNVITGLFLSVHAFAAFENLKMQGFSMEALWKHSLETAMLAKKICGQESRNPIIANEAFVAGILHDSGRIILASNFPDKYQKVIAMARESDLTVCAAEEKIFGHNHGAVGGYMMILWGLPAPIVETVANHHAPGGVAAHEFCAVTAVHAANGLVQSCFCPEADIAPSLPDMDYLQSMNLLDRLPAWRQLTACP